MTRGPTSPRLAPPLLSSVQLDAVPVSAPRRVAARYIIQLCHSSYTGAMEGLVAGWGEMGRRERQRDAPLRAGNAALGVAIMKL